MSDAEEPRLILDHIEPIHLTREEYQAIPNAGRALGQWFDGLAQLAREMESIEQKAQTAFATTGRLDAAGIPWGFMGCIHQWYSVTAVQYIRLVGAIARKADPARPKSKDYAQGVSPALVAWRDKVGAHIALASENEKDNPAERMISGIMPISWSNGGFVAGLWVATVRSAGKVSTSNVVRPWRLLDEHRRLGERYWPHLLKTAPAT